MTNDKKTKVVLSFDDIDTLRGGCTTHFATKIINIFLSRGWKLEDFPRLVRLNPDIPWKTRGNAAISIVLSNEKIASIEDIAYLVQEEFVSYTSSNEPITGHSQPTFIVADYDAISSRSYYFRRLYRNAIKETLDIKTIEKELWKIIKEEEKRIVIKSLIGKRGLIGTLASIGYIFENDDYTFELLAYKRDQEINKKNLDNKLLYSFFLKYEDIFTFGNIDVYSKKSIVTPYGPDPVLFGLRGDNPLSLLSIFREIVNYYGNLIDIWMLFKTNQGTDVHHRRFNKRNIGSLYSQIEVVGWKIREKEILPSGHHIFKINVLELEAPSSSEIEIACYRESLKMRWLLGKLGEEDLLLLFGNTKRKFDLSSTTLNLEKNYVIYRKTQPKNVKPLCPKCFNTLESEGREKGLRCRKCNYRLFVIDSHKITAGKEFTPTVFHEPPMYQRHLTKPLKRFGREDMIKSRESEEVVLEFINNEYVRR